MAAIVRSCERSAQRSRSARVISSSSPTSVASSNICLPLNGLREAVVDHRVERLHVAHAERRSAPAGAGTAPATWTPCRPPRRRRGRPRGPRRRSCPAARTPEAHTLLIVSELTSRRDAGGDLRLARRDLAAPAWSTWPITTCWTCSGATSARSSAARIAMPPSSRAPGARRGRRPACRSGVRAAPRMTVVGMAETIASAAHGRYGPPRRRRPPRAPTPSSSASSRARASRTTPRTARCSALVDSGEARRGLRKLAVTHAGGRRWILAGLGARDALRPRARADRRRGRARPRAGAGRARAVLGGAPPRRRRARGRAGRGHAAGGVRVHARTSRGADDDAPARGARRLRPPRRRRGRGRRGRVRRRGGQPRARPRRTRRPTR